MLSGASRQRRRPMRDSSLFHPTQTSEDEPDGSLIVRFRAGGTLEMYWLCVPRTSSALIW
jgi:hypothetical protein